MQNQIPVTPPAAEPSWDVEPTVVKVVKHIPAPKAPEAPSLPSKQPKLSPGRAAYQAALAKAKAKAKAKARSVEPVAPPTAVAVKAAKAAKPKPVVLKAAKPKSASKPAKPALGSHCSICGKPLNRATSVEHGMGDICAGKMKLLPAGTTMADHYALLSLLEVPEGYILLKDAIVEAKAKKISGYRFLQACGGDRMLHAPFNANFKVVFVLGKRYIPKACLDDLKLLVKV